MHNLKVYDATAMSFSLMIIYDYTYSIGAKNTQLQKQDL